MQTRDAFSDGRLHQAPRISSAWCGDELVLLDSTTGKYFTLNRVGGRVWELLATSRSANDLAECLSTEYEVQPGPLEATIHRDVVRILDGMCKAGLLVAENRSAAKSPKSIAGRGR